MTLNIEVNTLKMRFGLVGPKEITDKMLYILREEFPQIEPVLFVYTDYVQAPGLIEHAQEKLDALLFAGTTPCSYAEKRIKPTIPWDFIPRSGSSLMQVLLQIALSEKYNLYRVSSDVYGRDQLAETYAEIGIDMNRCQIFTPQKTESEEDRIEFICAFH